MSVLFSYSSFSSFFRSDILGWKGGSRQLRSWSFRLLRKFCSVESPNVDFRSVGWKWPEDCREEEEDEDCLERAAGLPSTSESEEDEEYWDDGLRDDAALPATPWRLVDEENEDCLERAAVLPPSPECEEDEEHWDDGLRDAAAATLFE